MDLASVHIPEDIMIHLRPAVDTAAKHSEMNEIPRILAHDPRTFEVSYSKTYVWRNSRQKVSQGPKTNNDSRQTWQAVC